MSVIDYLQSWDEPVTVHKCLLFHTIKEIRESKDKLQQLMQKEADEFTLANANSELTRYVQLKKRLDVLFREFDGTTNETVSEPSGRGVHKRAS